MDTLIDNIKLGENYGLCTFETLNHKKIYSVFKKSKTSIKQIIDNFMDNYECHNLGQNQQIDFFCVHLNKNLNKTDLICPTIFFPTKFTLILKVNVTQKFGESQQELKNKINEIDTTNNNNKITIFVKSMSNKVTTVYAVPSDTIETLKLLVYKKEGFMCPGRLLFCGKILDDERTLEDYNIRNDYTLHMILNLRGGMYHETSGKMGNYQPIKSIVLYLNCNEKMFQNKN